MSDNFTFERVGDNKFKWQVTYLTEQDLTVSYQTSEDLSGLLWVDKKTKEFVAVWFIEDNCNFIAYCKKGDDHYSHKELRFLFHDPFQRVSDIVLHGFFLYVAMTHVLVVQNNLYETNIENRKSFSIFKKDPKANPKEHYNLVEIDSLGDEEAMLLDLGVTVPGIEPNSIYFTRHDRVFLRKHLKLDICVFNLETKTLKSFGSLSNLKLKDARWFLPCI
ncbi:hypothetical protein AtEden1_Chr2g0232381 [Arabidopsis thaliana]